MRILISLNKIFLTALDFQINMKLVSWNVNGIRAAITKGFIEFVKKEDPDVLCIQETKAQQNQVQINLEGYYQYWNSADKKGYSGTLIFTKIKPINIHYGIGIDEHDKEGRVITVEYDNYFLTTVYTPNSKRGLERIDYRMEWEDDFLKFMKNLEKTKPVIFCGDLNVAHEEIDIARPKSNMTTATKPGNAGFSDKERNKFRYLLKSGFIDTFRFLYPDKKDAYSWWTYMFNARTNNVGWRIDYFIVSDSLKNKLKDARILMDVMGSDHCPVCLELK